ncbi:hypothetical protein HRR83_003218 [Exophiala dermatitidis]|uniref:DUF7908 domain-containing protein n=1 Tax=Exophiala dermatitidis TaxID=5970 RepID=A0AAN6EWX7_EXODE|nr:hypothetical protein HRR74_004625 [Exophiala dermatitidis]KAJ4521228.1 hypothetical protein HRR73_003569 [Exophiala dermatitidis]KAJ4547820.1 hypothetical protein HRR76_000443 [Exophiala dermatitidis]KAJ4553758.1 hypothetical protein HRR77_002132 [Exophiala dermatitidis]KAJ4578086.1 hypothetical protein HRR79_001404 [Exophiala dermatitidis]
MALTTSSSTTTAISTSSSSVTSETSSAPSSFTTSTRTSSSVSTTATTSTSTLPELTPDPAPTAVTGDGSFYIALTSNDPTRRHKRATTFMGFSGTNAIVVTDESLAWPLKLSSGSHILGFSGKSGYVGTDSQSVAGPVRRVSDDQTYAPKYFMGWNIDSQTGAVTFGNAQFCTLTNGQIYTYWDGVLPDGCDAVTVTQYSLPPPVADESNTVDGAFQIEVDGLSSTYYVAFCGSYQDEPRICNYGAVFTMSIGQVTTRNGTGGWLVAPTDSVYVTTPQALTVVSSLSTDPVYNRWIVDSDGYLQMPAVGSSPAASFSGSAGGIVYYQFNGAASSIKLRVRKLSSATSTTSTSSLVVTTPDATTTSTTLTTTTTTSIVTTTTHLTKPDFTLTVTDVQSATSPGLPAPTDTTRYPGCKTGANPAYCGTEVTGTGLYEAEYTVYCHEFWSGGLSTDSVNDASYLPSQGWNADSFDDCLQMCDNAADCVAITFSSNSQCTSANCRLLTDVRVRYTDGALNDYSSWDSAALGDAVQGTEPQSTSTSTTTTAESTLTGSTTTTLGSTTATPTSTTSSILGSTSSGSSSTLSYANSSSTSTTSSQVTSTSVYLSTTTPATTITTLATTTTTISTTTTTPATPCNAGGAHPTFSLISSGSSAFPDGSVAVVVPSGTPSYPFDYVGFDSPSSSGTLFTFDDQGRLIDLTDGNIAAVPSGGSGAASFPFAPQSTMNNLGFQSPSCGLYCPESGVGRPILACSVYGYTLLATQVGFPYLAIANYRPADAVPITLEAVIVGQSESGTTSTPSQSSTTSGIATSTTTADTSTTSAETSTTPAETSTTTAETSTTSASTTTTTTTELGPQPPPAAATTSSTIGDDQTSFDSPTTSTTLAGTTTTTAEAITTTTTSDTTTTTTTTSETTTTTTTTTTTSTTTTTTPPVITTAVPTGLAPP